MNHQFDRLKQTMAKADEAATKQGIKPPYEAPEAPASRNEVVCICASDIETKPIDWLWYGWLAAGKFHLLAGAPGQGKTTIALAVAAIITKGGKWPDGTHAKRGKVLIWSGEDDPSDTLKPRLMAAGADLNRCFFIMGRKDKDGTIQAFDPANDMQTLKEAAERIGNVKLLIVDPVASAVAGDSYKNTEVRRGLQPIVDLASDLGMAVLGITHLSKGGAGVDPAMRVLGSVAFTAVARIVWLAGKSNERDNVGEPMRVLVKAKANVAIDEGGISYSIEQAEPVQGLETSRIEWGGVVAGTAGELLQGSEDSGGANGSAKDEAKEWLSELLAGGTHPTATIEAEAKAAGLSWATVRRASSDLSVSKKKGPTGNWYWKLPDHVAHVAHVAHVSESEQVEQVESPPSTTTHKSPKQALELEQVELHEIATHKAVHGQWGEDEITTYQAKLEALITGGISEAEAEKLAGQFVDAMLTVQP